MPEPDSLIPWSKARRRLSAAKTDIDWLLLAFDVQIPPKVAAARPDRYRVLQELRSNRQLRTEFHSMLLNRMAAKVQVDKEKPEITLDEILARKEPRRVGR